MGLNLITAPTVKPVTVADVAAQVRADLTAESTLVDLYIAAVTAKAENFIKRALVNQTWELTLDHFPIVSCDLMGVRDPAYIPNKISLPLAPVQSITSIKYIDVDGVQQTLTGTEYTLTADDPNCVVPAYGKTWPSARLQPGSVTIRYVAGYGATSASVPESIRAWILMNVASLYENRESVTVGKGQLVELNTFADSLLDSYVLRSFL